MASNSFDIAAQSPEPGWKAGISEIDITPEEYIWMAGYAARTRPADGKIHDLKAKALFLEDSKGERALLITTDLLGFSKPISDRIRSDLYSSMGLTKAQIILSSSHTHSGPALKKALIDIYPMDSYQKEKIDEYSDWLVEQILKLARRAERSLRPARIYSNNGVVRFQVNRRNNKESKIPGLTELDGPNDFAVPVLKVENKRGRIKAIVFGYACHATVLKGYKWCGDYPGFAQLELEDKYKRATAMFFQGAGADQNPLPRRSVSLARQYGKELAAAVERVLEEDMNELSPVLNTTYSEIDLELSEPPTKEELIRKEKELKGYRKRWATSNLEKLERGESFITSYPYPVQFWQLGDQIMASLGGELLIKYSNNLKKIFGDDIFVMGYANDVMGYIPSERVLREGGYEGETSQMGYGMPSVWAPGIETKITTEVFKLAERSGISLKEGSSEKTDDIVNNLATWIDSYETKRLTAKKYFSGFALAHDTYNAISTASDGKIYYCLSSQSIDTGGQIYTYDPETDEISYLADLTEVCGEADAGAIPQGKSHSNFYECDGKLYLSTHVGYYEIIDGMECLPVNAPEGYKLYPGGHFISYDLSDGTFEDIATAPEGEGILTMTMDAKRKQIYAITWPTGYFVHLDVNTGELINIGPVSAKGEAGKVGEDYRVLCRSMFVDPRDGKVYYSVSEGDIYSYDPDMQDINKLEGVNLRLDYFGEYDPARPGSMGYNWRRIIWYAPEGVAYGVHGNSGYLFRFDPRGKKIELVRRITSELSQRSGMYDQFSYGYLGFELGNDGETLYYLTGGPIYIDGKRVRGVDEIAMGAARGLENLHVITYHIPSGKYTDHGAVFYQDNSRPTYVNSIAIDKDGNVYTLARFEHNEKLIQDLVKIPNPFRQ